MFLRKLEYYNGILFLTTNRIGKLDPALTSRIHLILHYKRLGADEIASIFQTNIGRLRQAEAQQQKHLGSIGDGESALEIDEDGIMRFAADLYNRHPKGKGAWNGRQIRNAFVVAAALARHDHTSSGTSPAHESPTVRYHHFAEVEKLTREYDRFRAQLLDGDDSFRARLFGERDDDYESEHDDDDDDDSTDGQTELIRILLKAQQALAATTGKGKGKVTEENVE